jgi:hypothetical protein
LEKRFWLLPHGAAFSLPFCILRYFIIKRKIILMTDSEKIIAAKAYLEKVGEIIRSQAEKANGQEKVYLNKTLSAYENVYRLLR